MSTQVQSAVDSIFAHDLELAPGVKVNPAAWTPEAQQVLTPEALAFVAKLHRSLEGERQRLLAYRREWQAAIDAGQDPQYLNPNSEAASGDWRIAGIPQDLMRRRVEITGPASSAKMVINMLSRNAQGDRADTAMLDFEDAMKPSWANQMSAHVNVMGASRGDLEYVEPPRKNAAEKVYRLNPDDMAVIIIRPRGLHLDEVNLSVDEQPVSGALLDTALTFFHNARTLMAQGKTPAYYIPKVEQHQEARWWDTMFAQMEQELGIAHGTLKATFLIETLPAAFQMEEILYESRDHVVGLNVGRWDKIFSDIKVLKHHADRVLADRAHISMTQPWMANYALRCVKISHSRGAFGIGDMAAFTPGRTPERVQEQTDKVVADKKLEAETGHDGCWVSHPYFIGPAMQAFTRDNQLDVLHEDKDKFPELLPQPIGPKTMAGLRTNVRVGIGYMNGWLNQDAGVVAWDDLMEDLATLEISRTQVWQWRHYGVQLDDGPQVTEALIRQVFSEELDKILAEQRELMAGEDASQRKAVEEGFVQAAREAEEIFTREELQEFLTFSSERVA